MKIKILKEKNNKTGQSIIEYCIVFSVVLAVIIVATLNFIRPSLEGFYEKTSKVINDINPTLIND